MSRANLLVVHNDTTVASGRALLRPRRDTVKLLESPKAYITKLETKATSGQEKRLGYGDNMYDATMGNQQRSPTVASFLSDHG